MSAASLFDANPAEPLAFQRLSRSVPSCPAGYVPIGFEFTSRGDRVPGCLLLPDTGTPPWPLVVAQHGVGGSAEAEAVAVARWLGSGTAVACIDLPLHGERTSAKLTERFLGLQATTSAHSALETRLFGDWVRQAVIDLRRALHGLAGLPEIDGKRVTCQGRDLGSLVAMLFFAAEPELRAGVLVDAAAGLGPPEMDPIGHVAGTAGRPLLFVNAEQDPRTPRDRVEALHAAAPDTTRVHWVETPGASLPDVARGFLAGEAVD